MGSLGTAVARDIRNRFKSDDFANDVGEKAGKVVLRSIKRQTQNAQDPSGDSFIPLADFYAEFKSEFAGNTKPNLRSGYQFPSGNRKPEAMDELMFEPDGNEINFNFGGYGEAEDYMGDHQEGMNGMPERRWFPEEDRDANSNVQKQNTKKVEGILSKFLNQSRTVKASSR